MLVAVASLIHRSAMVFFAAYLIMRIPINLWWGFLYTIIGIGAFYAKWFYIKKSAE